MDKQTDAAPCPGCAKQSAKIDRMRTEIENKTGKIATLNALLETADQNTLELRGVTSNFAAMIEQIALGALGRPLTDADTPGTLIARIAELRRFETEHERLQIWITGLAEKLELTGVDARNPEVVIEICVERFKAMEKKALEDGTGIWGEDLDKLDARDK